MGSTFLSLTNKVLRKLNEVELTSINFSTATGFHAVAKDSVNESIRFINQEEFQWPFNHQVGSQTMTSGIQEYALPSDYKSIDWETFFLQRDSSFSIEGRHLPVKEYDEWIRRYRGNDEQIIDNISAGTSTPAIVFRTQKETFVVSPPPSRAYVIKFDYWNAATDLSTDSDTTNIPTRFDDVIKNGAMIGVYMFRENLESANKAEDRFLRGVKNMRTQLINSYHHMFDLRTGNSMSRI